MNLLTNIIVIKYVDCSIDITNELQKYLYTKNICWTSSKNEFFLKPLYDDDGDLLIYDGVLYTIHSKAIDSLVKKYKNVIFTNPNIIMREKKLIKIKKRMKKNKFKLFSFFA